MKRRTPGMLSVLLLVAAAGQGGEEHQALSLVSPQPLRSSEVTATGRIVPLFTTVIGSRLAAHIVDWGKNEAGQPLDVGMPVKAGQKLFGVAPDTFQAKVDSERAKLDSAEAALANLKAPTRKERLDVFHTALAEVDARISDRQREEARYRRLVEVDHTMPVKKLEEVQLELEVLKAQREAAQARLDEAKAGPTQTEIAVAEAKVKEARTLLATAQLDRDDTTVAAPFDAVITRRMKGLGDYVAGAPFVEVLELTTVDRLEADLRLPEAYLSQVVPGKTHLVLRSPLLPKGLELAVTRIIPDIDVQQGTFAFRAAISPAQRGALVSGAFVTAAMDFTDQSEGVLLPQRAVRTEGGKTCVFVAAGDKMVRRAVELGDRLTEGVIVRSGVRPDERVVVGPAELIQDGAPLPESLRPQTSPNPPAGSQPAGGSVK
jgi:HlyD family secretion protein